MKQVAVTMISGRKIIGEEDNNLRKMRLFEQLISANFSSSSGWELDYFPWLRHFGHPAFKELQVCLTFKTAATACTAI